MSNITVEGIAAGESFDPVEAIRAIARFLVAPASVSAEQILAEDVTPIQRLTEVFGAKIAAALLLAGYASIDQVAAASDDELLAIKGIGDSALGQIRTALGD